MTPKEGIYDVREGLKLLNIDSDTTDRHIMFLMNLYRATIIRQHITNNPGEYRNMLCQVLYMEVELVDESQFPDKFDFGTTMLVTKKALPNIIGQQMYKELEVRTIGRLGIEVEITHKERAQQYKYAPEGFIYGYRDTDGKLYFISKNSVYKNLTQVSVTTILEDPETILDINDLMTDLDVYPITYNLWVTVKDMVLNHLSRELGVISDKLTNNNDDQESTGQTTKAQQ
jgi:hypothetical protein